MVDPYLLTFGIIAVVVIVGIPLACVLALDLFAGRWAETKLRWYDRSLFRRRRPLRRTGPPLEQVAADLRRLRTTVRQDERRSALHQLGSRQAYDELLIMACRMLEITHELDRETGGVERALERFRVELALEDAGIVIDDRKGNGHRYGQAA